MIKKNLILVLFSCLSFVVQANTISVSSAAGGLLRSVVGAGGDPTTITNLTVTGIIDARDFVTMRDDMPQLAVVDLSAVTIAAYTGTGTSGIVGTTYPANEIPANAFNFNGKAKTSLMSIAMPFSITSIGTSAFDGCTGLTGSLTIPSAVTYIGNYAFNGCTGLTGSLTIPSAVTSIGNYAFNGCKGLTGSLTIPSLVTSIGNNAFFFCSGLNGSLNLSSSVKTIGDNAFNSCSGLTGSLTIPSSVTSIGISAFYSCIGLTGSLILPSSLKTIGDNAFNACKGLTGSITIPSSVTNIGFLAFWGCSGLITVDGNNPNYSSEDGVLFNKDKTLLIFCFTFKTGSYTIPSSVTTIGDDAFWGCTGLTGLLTIPSSVATIGKYAFSGCTGFTGLLTIPASVTFIGEEAFSYCLNITGSYIPKSVTSVGFKAFFHCGGLLEVDENNPNYSSAEGILFNKDKTTFIFCSTFKPGSYDIPHSVTSIGDYAFDDCQNLTGPITIPSSVTSIGTYSFRSCSGLSGELAIPSSVTSIGFLAFYYCSGFIMVDPADPNYSSADGVLFNKDKTMLIFCPQYKNGSYTIPSSVTSISSSAFLDCNNLTGSLTIPSSVNAIGFHAFYNCSKLSSIKASGAMPGAISLGAAVFYGIEKSTCKLHVPVGAKALYTAAEQWKDFTITDDTPDVTTQIVSDITTTQATGNGTITDLGISHPTSYGVCWNKSGAPMISDSKVDKGEIFTTGAFTVEMKSLIPNTTYHVRAFATNAIGTGYGDEITFTTNDIAPNISYSTPQIYAVGTPITVLIPTNTGGVVPGNGGFIYTISPALPAGLSFDAATGSISGTPTATSSYTIYSVTAVNNGGTSNIAKISISVKSPQTISFYPLPVSTYGDVPYTLTATTTSGLNLSYSSDNAAVATVSGNIITIVGVGKANIKVSQSGNIIYAPANVTQQLTVNKKPLTVVAKSDTKTYDGTVGSKLTPTMGALVLGDEVSTAPMQVFDDASAGTRSLKAFGLIVKNNNNDVTEKYDITYTSASGVINKRSLTVTALADTKTYDGTTVSQATPIVGVLATGDVVNVAPIQVFDKAAVGTHSLKASGLSVRNNSADVTGNYDIQYMDADGTILAKPLTISDPIVTLNKNYDGTTSAAVIAGTLLGVVVNDKDYVVAKPVGTYDNATIGVNKTIKVVYTLTGSAAANYVTPVEYVISGARILETITLNPLLIPTPGCEATDVLLTCSVLSGIPKQYKIKFDDVALAAGMQNINYTNLILSGTSAAVSFRLPDKMKYGTYHGTLQMQTAFATESPAYDFQFTVNVSSDYIIPKFNDVVLCDNSTNAFVAYQWYKNGIAIDGATEQFYNDPAGLNGSYSLKLITSDGKTVYSCSKVMATSKAQKVTACPSFVEPSQICTVKTIGFLAEDLEGASLSIYTSQGICVYHSTKVEDVNSISLPPIAGMYLGKVTTAKGKDFQFKVVVLK